MRFRLLSLFVPLMCFSGCEAIGPNEIATWKIFHETRAGVVYTSVGSDSAASEKLAAGLDPHKVGAVVSAAQSLPEEAGAPTTGYGYAALVVSLDADFRKLLKPDPFTIKDFSELGPFPAYPIINIADISIALASTHVRR